ncbi:YqaE/Pmp3 family membrane protein [Sphingomonas bacterium]|uniref:YqaE/Pmp3 family membrane protein n=1 Tax=Sphingomonas bacterium TaxID=1895847 RepID=UPI0015751B55|nr:YqaE/Pmp3 family membrane protein [Sphingomonas bacterium]
MAAAILLPPLGLHLAMARPRLFWIGTVLTALGFLPGIAFALHAVLLGRDTVAGSRS